MEHKYFAAVYEDDMNDVLRKADVIATYDAVREDKDGKYSNTVMYHLGFDFHLLKEIRDARINLDYTNDDGDGYYINSGKLTDKNVKVDLSAFIKGELQRSKAFSKAMALRDKFADMSGERGVLDYKSDIPVPLIGFKSKVAYDKNIDLVLPFRERVVKTSDSRLPIIVYLHDEKAFGMNNIAQMPEAGYMLDAIKKSKREHIAIVPHALVPFGTRTDDGIKANAMTKLLDETLDYAVAKLGGDKNKIYIVGTGIGAVGAIRALTVEPKRYAGAVLAFGIEEAANISAFKDMNIEVVAADNDDKYLQDDFEDFVAEAKENGVDIRYTVFENSDHKAYKNYYKDGGFISRLLGDDASMPDSVNGEDKTQDASENVGETIQETKQDAGDGANSNSENDETANLNAEDNIDVAAHESESALEPCGEDVSETSDNEIQEKGASAEDAEKEETETEPVE